MSADTAATGGRAGQAFFASPPPTTAVEIARDRVAAVSLGYSGHEAVISAYAFEPLAASVLEPSLNSANIYDRAALTTAVQGVLEKVAPRASRIALVLPDTIAKVSLLRFEKVPVRVQDLDQLIRWQVRKAAPFKIEDAQVAWVPGISLPGGGREYLVTVARRDVIAGYERACEAAGVYAGVVDLATYNVVNSVLASAGGSSGDWLLVHVAADYATLAVVRGSDLVFFRNRTLGEDVELTDLVHQTAMYHEDRLGGGAFSRVVLAGAWVRGPDSAEGLRRAIEERVGMRVEPVDFKGAASLRDRITANPALLDVLAPAVGMLLRERAPHRGGDASLTGRVA
jgi:type IV pilus assembly protein PilM